MQGQLTLQRSQPATPMTLPKSPSRTLPKELIRRRHREHEAFDARSGKDAVQVGAHRWAPAWAVLGLTLSEFAVLLKGALGWMMMRESITRRGTESISLGDVVLFCQAVLAAARGGGLAGPTAPGPRETDGLTERCATWRQQ
jgi:hypothetical protein